MKVNSNQLVTTILGLMVVALAATLLLQEAEPVAPASAPKSVEKVAPRLAAVAVKEDALERALRARIRALEGEVAALRAAQASATNPVPAEAVGAAAKPGSFRPPNPREWVENLKKNDPKRYAEMKRWRERMRQRGLARTRDRIDFLSSASTASMTKEERANHARYQELLARRENQQIDPEQMSDEEMRAAMDERRQLEHEIRQAARTERTALLKETATELGFTGEDAAELTTTLNEIYEATRSEGFGPPPGPQPGGGAPPR